jgi:hypothetical protein
MAVGRGVRGLEMALGLAVVARFGGFGLGFVVDFVIAFDFAFAFVRVGMIYPSC